MCRYRQKIPPVGSGSGSLVSTVGFSELFSVVGRFVGSVVFVVVVRGFRFWRAFRYRDPCSALGIGPTCGDNRLRGRPQVIMVTSRSPA